MTGSHFRRQVPIGPYIADFACLAARLGIEVDGSQHALTDEATRDAERTRWLEAEGYKVIRFWNNDIVKDIDGVLAAVYAALYGSIDGEPHLLRHKRHRMDSRSDHPTPARKAGLARRPSPSRGG
jgi:very-short-patch-repair endonuclease